MDAGIALLVLMIVALYVGVAWLFGTEARRKGRGFWDWAIISVIAGLIAPVIGWVIVGVIIATWKPAPATRATKACPSCAEQVLVEARKCRYCGEILEPVDQGNANASGGNAG